MLAVSEIFGPTVQGEGASLGMQATFLRMAGCNLACSWCDTKYTWDWEHYDKDKEVHMRTALDVSEELLTHKTPLLVITGGEPLLQQGELLRVGAIDTFEQVEFETNGSIPPAEEWTWRQNVYWNISPKLSNAGNAETRPQNWPIFTGAAKMARHKRARFKFVCTGPEDLDEVQQIIDLCGILPEAVWIMPEGTTKEQLENRLVLSHLADAAVQRGWNLTTRLHVQLWGNKRGV